MAVFTAIKITVAIGEGACVLEAAAKFAPSSKIQEVVNTALDLVKKAQVPLTKFYTIFVLDSLTKNELSVGKLFSDYFAQNNQANIEVVIECSEVEEVLSNH